MHSYLFIMIISENSQCNKMLCESDIIVKKKYFFALEAVNHFVFEFCVRPKSLSFHYSYNKLYIDVLIMP